MLLEPKLQATWRRSASPEQESLWEFEDEQGRPWQAGFTLAAAGEEQWTLTLEIDRR